MLHINKFTAFVTLLSVLPMISLPTSAQRTLVKQTAKKKPLVKQQSYVSKMDFARRMVEEELTQWKPTKANASFSDATLLNSHADIVGKWQTDRRSENSTLIIQRSQAETYTVEFKTGGCLRRWSLKRTGRFDKGVLLLDRPVQEYCGWTYRRLYTVHIGNKNYLVSDAVITAFMKGVSADRKSIDWLTKRFLTFTKKYVRPSQRTPPNPPRLRKGEAVALAE